MSDFKKKDIEERIARLENDIAKANEYLQTGKNAEWHKFKPLFKEKYKEGKEQPPHRDWVRNVFIPKKEKALVKAEELLERFD